MRKAIIGVGAATLLVLGASPATAETERVNAAENVTRYESIGDFCNVAVDDFDDMEVNVFASAMVALGSRSVCQESREELPA